VDIVLFDDVVLDGPGHLRIPRPELDQPFVLVPMCDIAPAVRNPASGRTLAEMLEEQGPSSGLTRLPIDLEAG